IGGCARGGRATGRTGRRALRGTATQGGEVHATPRRHTPGSTGRAGPGGATGATSAWGGTCGVALLDEADAHLEHPLEGGEMGTGVGGGHRGRDGRHDRLRALGERGRSRRLGTGHLAELVEFLDGRNLARRAG